MQIVLYRDTALGAWMATYLHPDHADTLTTRTEHKAEENAKDVASAVARAHPHTLLGVKSTEFGPETVAAFGPVVWLREGFEN